MEGIKDYKLWCKQNDLKENSYKSLKLYLAGKAIMQLSEEFAQAFMKEHNYELLYAIECIVAVAKEEARKTNGPGYMLEKLNNAKQYLDSVIKNYKGVENEL